MRNNNIVDLHPIMRSPVSRLIQSLQRAYHAGETKTDFRFFEGYRSADDQDELYKAGTATQARGWQSAHQYGLAADIVPYVNEKPSWDDSHDWELLKHKATGVGLEVPIAWDRCHVQHPDWDFLKMRLRRQ